eukprot:GHUV01030047.1.p1 GENE.GHUV01030047.1~~GHUV01030047.1.p1  ORF type:complete len:134 (-),score=44.69 GHUV01030047.1:397-798(-)
MLESGLKSLREALAAKAAASQAKAAEDAKRKPSAIAEVDGQASKQDGAASKQDIGSGGRAGNSSNGGRTSGLLSQFKWGCPDDSKQVELRSLVEAGGAISAELLLVDACDWFVLHCQPGCSTTNTVCHDAGSL